MLRALSGAIALSALAVPAHAESLGVSTDVAFESRYVFRGVQLQEASVQPAVTLSYGSFYAMKPYLSILASPIIPTRTQ